MFRVCKSGDALNCKKKKKREGKDVTFVCVQCVCAYYSMHASVATSFARRASRFGEKGFLRLTTKLSKKSGYYKGKKAVSPGWHEKKAKGGKGQFVLLDWKRPTYVVPKEEALDKSGFDLKPYVAKSVLKAPNKE